MSESSASTPLPAPEAGPSLSVVAPEGRPRFQFELDRRQLRELTNARAVAKAAQEAAFTALLEQRGISALFVTTLLGDIDAAYEHGSEAVEADGAAQSATDSSGTAKSKLVKSLRQIQSAAKQKHLYSDPARLTDYLVGEPIARSRPVLEQSAQTIISKADEDRPPGIDTGFINQATTDRAAFVDSKAPQEAQQQQARQERIARDQMVESIKQRRVQIQLAADSAWPARVAENAAIRRRFRLQPNRTFNG